MRGLPSALGGLAIRLIVIAGVQTSSLAMALYRSIKLGGRGLLQAISLLRQTLRKNNLNLITNAEINPAGSEIDATVDKTTAFVHWKVSLRARFSERSCGPLYAPFLPFLPKKTFGRKVKVSSTGFHL